MSSNCQPDRPPIDSPNHPDLEELCTYLANESANLTTVDDWPGDSLSHCAERGVLRWFVPTELGGFGWSQTDIAKGYLRLGAACLPTTFIITQWVAAVKRLLACPNHKLRDDLLPELLDGTSHITVGISHLTTSRRHLNKPALLAAPIENQFHLKGFIPWVTAAPFTKYILTGAQLESGQQILAIVSTESSAIQVQKSESLLALSASCTASVQFNDVAIDQHQIVAGPDENVLVALNAAGNSNAANTGGFQTSTLALALASAAIEFIEEQSEQRNELAGTAVELRQQWQRMVDDLMQLAVGEIACSNEDLRSRSNSLVLRATQSAMIAAKGTGFVSGHPVERWCRQAMFFLVWSCPQSVQDANLCELASIP